MTNDNFNESKLLNRIIILSDTAIVIVSLLLSELILQAFAPQCKAGDNLFLCGWVTSLSYILSSLCIKPVVSDCNVHFYRVMERTFRSVMLLGVLSTAFLFFQKETGMLRTLLVVFLAVFTCLLLFARLLEHIFFRHLYTKGRLRSRMVMVAPGGIKKQSLEFIKNNADTIEMLFTTEGDCYGAVSTEFYSPDAVKEHLETHSQTNTLIFIPEQNSDEAGSKLLKMCRNHKIRMYVMQETDLGRNVNLTPARYNGSWFLSPPDLPLQEIGNKLIKRIFDIALALFFLLTLFPFIYLIVFIITKIQSPGPIFFTQYRSGLDGKGFTCVKFRSKHINNPDNSRKFAFGTFMRKCKIDRLPQVFCILKGDMSFVGPRHYTLQNTEEHSKLIDNYTLRNMAKPGLSGWAQITTSRNKAKEPSRMEDCVKRDIWYIEHWSLTLDIYIIFKTLWNMIVRKDNKTYRTK